MLLITITKPPFCSIELRQFDSELYFIIYTCAQFLIVTCLNASYEKRNALLSIPYQHLFSHANERWSIMGALTSLQTLSSTNCDVMLLKLFNVPRCGELRTWSLSRWTLNRTDTSMEETAT